MATFSHDILREIFLRLPARPLVRFRCVCKSWNSLLTCPFFIKAYNERSIKLHKFDLLKYDFDNLSRALIHYSSEKKSSDLGVSFPLDGKKFKIVGSCNGIVCLSPFNARNHDWPRIFLWNPSTGENIVLPTPKFNVPNLVGFGFNPSSGHLDDFRVVTIHVEYQRYRNTTYQVEVYSFRRNCWEQLGNIFPTSVSLPSGDQVIFENFICWWDFRDSFYREIGTFILFDVVENVFQKLALPDIMPPREKRIGLYNGCLSIIVHNSSTTNYEVWIMKEFGVPESWTKLYTIEVSTKGIVRHWPLGFADSGDVFFLKSIFRGIRFKCPTYSVLYNVQREQFDAFEVEIDSSHSAQLVTCMESLISLSPMNNVEH